MLGNIVIAPYKDLTLFIVQGFSVAFQYFRLSNIGTRHEIRNASVSAYISKIGVT